MSEVSMTGKATGKGKVSLSVLNVSLYYGTVMQYEYLFQTDLSL